MPQGAGAFLGPLEETLVQFNTEASAAGDWIHGESFSWEGRIVLYEGEKPQWVTLFNLTDVAISGFELSKV
jgi:hypothetical protein